MTRAEAAMKRILSMLTKEQVEKWKGTHSFLGLYDCLFQASLDGEIELVMKLIEEQGVPVDCDDPKACTALHAAAWNGHAEIANYLLQRGADYKRTTICFPKTIQDKTPLGVVIERHHHMVDEDFKNKLQQTITVIAQWIVSHP